MRPIDADALEKAIYKWMPKDQETWMDSEIPPIENLVVSIMMTIQEQPTVDAIPIEWINRWYDKYQYAEVGDLLNEWAEVKKNEDISKSPL